MLNASAETATEAAGGRSMTANVFTAPPGMPFLRALAQAIIAGDLPRPGGSAPSPLELSEMTILLPTRRAARGLQEAFLDAANGRAMLLPRIQPIAEGSEDLSLLTSLSGAQSLNPGYADIPPAVGEVERRIVLTGLVQRWSEMMRSAGEGASETDQAALVVAAGAGTAAQAAALAAELGRLMDEVETEDISLAGLSGIVPEAFSEHWQKTLTFLEIILKFWPDYLREKELLSPADRRNQLIRAEAERLAKKPPSGPVIVAGVTGSIPATVALMRVVAGLPNGALVLPGLDLDLDEESWQAIQRPAPDVAHPEHPHFGMKRLLDALGIDRQDIQPLPGATLPRQSVERNRLVSEAMRPASTTERWHAFTQSAGRAAIRDALADVSLIEAASAEDEAEAISLIMREVLETPGRTAALVSRDRLLARRVVVRLEAWGIRVDDSAGRPLAKSMPGAFLDLVVEAISSDFTPAAVVALLKHPLTRLGLPAWEMRRAARALEIAIFRTLYLGRGLDGMATALDQARQEVAGRERRGRAVQRLRDEDWAGARDAVERLTKAYQPLAVMFSIRERQDFRALTNAHVAVAEAVAALPEGDKARGLWAETAGETASHFFAGLVDERLPPLSLPAREYPDLYRGMVARETVRSTVPLHPRLSIWGPLEARLQQPDVVIVGALNEGAWPEQIDPGPWLSRPMRQALGMPSPEEKIGYTAHDFAMLLGAPTVYLTRSLKVDGVPAVPSRWLLRLRALLDALQVSDALQPKQPWLAWASWRNAITRGPPLKAPEPRPPVEFRPRKLSVSSVETWMGNPYAIFAREILRLDPLPPLGGEPDASLRGGVIHAALSAFAKAHPGEMPVEAAAKLMAFARLELETLTGNPRVAAFWLPRLERFAEWFVETEPGRRADVIKALTEVAGQLALPGPAGPFLLTARADRIDVRSDGAVVTDYKSGAGLGTLKTNAQKGFAPQLALEAAIALAGGFAGLDVDRIAVLRYISASGGEPPGQDVPLKTDDPAALAQQARAGLERLIADFDRVETPYKAVRRARFSYDYDDYAHLARAAEWAGGGDNSAED